MSKMPCAHWLMSWNENGIPDDAQIRQAVDMFLKGMGLEGHQVIVALHTNTQNIHAHIVVNRVHPDTLKVIQPHNGFDIEAAHKIVALIEKTHAPAPCPSRRPFAKNRLFATYLGLRIWSAGRHLGAWATA